jgi:hypothetical protein
VLTLNLELPESWLVEPVMALHDLDNLRLADIHEQVQGHGVRRGRSCQCFVAVTPHTLVAISQGVPVSAAVTTTTRCAVCVKVEGKRRAQAPGVDVKEQI